MTAKEFKKKLTAVRHGSWITYHAGYLFADRELDTVLDALAKEVWKAYKDGRVRLIQRRVRKNVCDYIAVKR